MVGSTRRLFIGCTAATALPLAGFAGSEPFVPGNELEQNLSGILNQLGGSAHFAQDGLLRVKLDRSQWGGFYQALSEQFPCPKVGINNVVEVRSDRSVTQLTLHG